MKKIGLTILTLFLIVFLVGCKPKTTGENEAVPAANPAPTEQKAETSVQNPTKLEPPKIESKQEESLPTKANLKMSFVPQAPYAHWDQLHEDACEEASLIVVDHFLKNTPLNSAIGEREIQDMVAWQLKNWDGHFDLGAEQIAQLAKDYLGYKNVKAVRNISILDIKKEIAAGNPVIVPTAGRKLYNPNYRQPGPIYHMLVVKGYDGDKFIAMDVGTRKGYDYVYDEKVLYTAAADWQDGLKENEKVIVVIEK
ncbi:MAG: hypothetical protein COX39_00425 [Candidatus Nealsonbacteria bacterium CG23_combo_of_CG06-09_8_20_14_all_40_13]|uniref:Peptidase C39-like domain-containing protein n=1 Tax=Candidatus Nealsonbacteria bacterium CG23_combo_of_CG06-09_8_20_14_all_40_13 TaxID=1974724 RepID=A0A2G9YRL2_9BACT|nr:MAG: hypothetical protein COX39_00425 [Candidatus Nealsonbacteria bacterium CG23_combo_of_CG06-09_8_20_14_all_40_13]PIR71255.1 MAG: hypothetical protein COU44_00575 [Candidatus Nealsonbacteria bacterium CG10_big_fil_rev_8_21_14_0_10_40_24]PIU43272.1 MAG: hypothetical protein COS97_01890 [Candidatus Nealsonbacteria bacterium CG07_land_8_20_14_0_80_40_10]